MARKPRFMLAYGSNLSHAEMHDRAPDATPQGVVYLSDARLVFRVVADVTCELDCVVPCGLWSISPEDERRLDVREGVAGGSYIKEELTYEDGKALIYFVNKKRTRGIYPPSQTYADRLRRGYRDFGIPETFLDEAIAYSFDSKAPCPETRARRQRQRLTREYRALVRMPDDVVRRRIEWANHVYHDGVLRRIDGHTR